MASTPWHAFLTLLTGLACACSTPTQVIVNVTGDEGISLQAESLRIEVITLEGNIVPQEASFGDALPALHLQPASMTLVPRDGDASRTYRVVATLMASEDGEETVVATRSIISSFVPGELMEVWLHFEDECAGVTCGSQQTCEAGDCVDACAAPNAPGGIRRSELQSCGSSCDFADEGGSCNDGAGRCWMGACCETCFDGTTCLAAEDRNENAAGFSGAECTACECGESFDAINGCVNSATVGELRLGDEHTCASFARVLYCWGNNDSGQVGVGELGGTFSSPQLLGGGLGAMALGADHSCAARPNESATCWGEGRRFELGHGDFVENVLSPDEVIVDGGPFEFMGAGQRYTCGTREDGVYCWGASSDGQTGVAGLSEESPPTRMPTRVLELPIRMLSTGRRTTCAIVDDGRLFCWGYNDSGAVGVPSVIPRVYEPVNAEETLWKTVSVRGFGLCAIDVEDRLFCRGQVRTDITRDSTIELRRETHILHQIGNERWQSIALGSHFLCGILEGGTLKCMGENDQGQLGGEGASVTPGPVGIVWRNVQAGDDFACALREDETLWCWGNNAFGQLGTTDPSDVHSTATEPPANTIFSSVPRRICPPGGSE